MTRARVMLRAAARAAWRALPETVRRPVYRLRYGAPAERQWIRDVINRDLAAVFAEVGPERLDVVEVSGGLRSALPWRSYRTLAYPEFDLCEPGAVPGRYDLVICEQVLEHVRDPLAAARTLRSLCREGGHVLVSTPFLLRIHGSPQDFWRFTPLGLSHLLESQGLSPLWIRSWGNRRAAAANFGRWRAYRPWHSLKNEPKLPIVLWALARPGPDPGGTSPSPG